GFEVRTLSAGAATRLHGVRAAGAVGFSVFYPSAVGGVAQTGNVVLVVVAAGGAAPDAAGVLAGTVAAHHELGPGQTVDLGCREADVYGIARSGTPTVSAGDLLGG
ncbi:MAG: hypothetical protein KIS66_13825, partial [Fimbriimonadaceae bacterium]|nr:hypothetical protein [Fimbriimonadaceae bacterium]